MEEYCKAELGYREIELNETKLRVYSDGTIWKMCKNGGVKCVKKDEWYLLKGTNNAGYLRSQINTKNIYIHRIIGLVYLGLDINDQLQEIDHINRIKTDNRVDNLRIVNRQQNNWNIESKGYYFNKKTGKYIASIRLNRKPIYLGSFNTAEEASNAYQSAKLIHHAILNPTQLVSNQQLKCQ